MDCAPRPAFAYPCGRDNGRNAHNTTEFMLVLDADGDVVLLN